MSSPKSATSGFLRQRLSTAEKYKGQLSHATEALNHPKVALRMDREAQCRAVWCELVSGVARSTGEVRLKVGGGSMLPILWPGDLVIVRRCEFTELKPGQIILHGREQRLTLHRIKRITGEQVITRGDSLRDYDPPVKPADILGQVDSISRGGRSVSPQLKLWQRVIASLLRQSHFLRRLTVYAQRCFGGGTVAYSASPSSTVGD